MRAIHVSLILAGLLFAGQALAGKSAQPVQNARQTTVPEVPAISPSNSDISSEEWEKLIATPPQGRLAFKEKKDAERAVVAAYEAGRLADLPPIAGDDGTIYYPYGQSWPTVVCAPLQVCVIQLGPGDKPSQVTLGQPGMWNMTQTMAGDTPMLAISPRFKGLHTNLLITATSPNGMSREYYVNLVSDESKYIPKVAFYYPDAITQQWTLEAKRFQATVNRRQATAENVAAQTVAALPSINAASLDFSWKIACASHGGWFSSAPSCAGIMPTRVFSDGVHTYIRMPDNLANTAGLPTIMAQNTAGQPAIINYRFKDGYFVVDGVPPRINLIAGMGNGSKQRVVTIQHEANSRP